MRTMFRTHKNNSARWRAAVQHALCCARACACLIHGTWKAMHCYVCDDHVHASLEYFSLLDLVEKDQAFYPPSTELKPYPHAIHGKWNLTTFVRLEERQESNAALMASVSICESKTYFTKHMIVCYQRAGVSNCVCYVSCGCMLQSTYGTRKWKGCLSDMSPIALHYSHIKKWHIK